MTTHSGILAWEISWTEGSDGLYSTGSQRVGHNLVTKQQYSFVCMYAYTHHICLIHSSLDGHLGCFHVLTILNCVAMNPGPYLRVGEGTYSQSKWVHRMQMYRKG